MLQIGSIGSAYSGSASQEQISRPNGPYIPKKATSSLQAIAEAMATDCQGVRRELGQQMLLAAEQKKQAAIDKRKACVDAKREKDRVENPEGHRKSVINSMKMPQLKAILTSFGVSVGKLRVADMKQMLSENSQWDLDNVPSEGKIAV